MNINFNRPLFLRYFVQFLFMALIAKGFSLALWFFLPKEGMQGSEQAQFVMPYMRYSVDGFRLSVPEIKMTEEASSLSIDSIVLKAIFMMGEEGIVVLAPKAKIEQSLSIVIGETFEGYTLEKVYSEYAMFSKNAKQYKLYLIEPTAASRRKSEQSSAQESVLHQISSEEVKKVIANPADIWKSIGMQPHFTNGKQDGYKVSFVKKGTIFESLGLRTGDVIQSINNKEIMNNAQAFGAYQEFKDAKALKVTILRGKETMELEYEIF